MVGGVLVLRSDDWVVIDRHRHVWTTAAAQEIAPPWVDTDLICKSGDPRAMPLDAFITETIEKLAGDDPEIVVDAIKAIRDNPGAGEHRLVNDFNAAMIANLIPV